MLVMLKQANSASYLSSAFLIRAVVVFLAYFLTARIGLSLYPVNQFATLIWLPTGISLAAVLLYGWRIFPAIFFGALFANIYQGAELHIAIIISAGNTLEALIGSYLLKHLVGFRNYFYTLGDVGGFIIFGAVASTLVSATIGSVALLWGGTIAINSFAPTWLAWWVGDIFGNILVVPLVLFWRKALREGFQPTISYIAETLFLFLFLLLISLTIFTGMLGTNNGNSSIAYLAYLPLVVIALRLSPKEYSLAILILSFVALSGTLSGGGVFASSSPVESLFFLVTFIGITSIAFLPISIVVQQKKELLLLKDEFLAIASHELKTPLTTIKIYSDLLSKKYAGESKNFRVIEEQVQVLTRLVDEMLDATKIDTEKMELERETFPITELVIKAVENAQKANRKRKIELTSRTKDSVHADRFKISQVLTNLLTNAVRYSDINNKIVVKITSNKRFVTVSVKDFGIGIKKNELNNVFKRFFQVRQPMRGRKGLGLGLYISHEIVRQHKGRMRVTSTYGRGSTFSFTLPIKK